MLTIISPAKKLDLERTAATPRATQPRLLDEAGVLVERMRQATAADFAELMKVSDAIAELNVDRFKAWETPFTTANAQPALLMFDGDVYGGIEHDAYERDDYAFAQKHLRILSGLYGLLRPMDLIQAYRLEMGTKLDVAGAKSLYEFWGSTITKMLAADIGKSGSRELINLASSEYSGAVQLDDLKANVITPVFKEDRGGTLKVIAFSAKRARGAMVNWIIRNRIESPDDLRGFDVGYRLDAKLSSDDEWVYVRTK